MDFNDAGIRRDGDDGLRIDGKAMLAHHSVHLAAGMFLKAPCDNSFATGVQAMKLEFSKFDISLFIGRFSEM